MPQTYPITTVCKQEWSKKISLAAMYTIPAEDDALPMLIEMEDILVRIHEKPIQETIVKQHIQYFMVGVFPIVCQKLIKSRYFKSQVVLKAANHIIEMTLALVPKFLYLTDKHIPFCQILTITMPYDEYYFKSNAQIQYKSYPYDYFEKKKKPTFASQLKQGDNVDILKFTKNQQKCEWSQGIVVHSEGQMLEIQYVYDANKKKAIVQRNSHILAPYKSKSQEKILWRKSLSVGDLVDAEDSFGVWYNATILSIQGEEELKKKVKMVYKVYNENGNKKDDKGKFFGFLDYCDMYNLYSPQIQPYCSNAKELCFEASRSSLDFIEDYNDNEFEEINGDILYALPRKRHTSSLFFTMLNTFGKAGGFTTVLDKLEKEKPNLLLLTHYVKGISSVHPYIHRKIITKVIKRLKKIIQQYIYSDDSEVSKHLTKQNSEMLFSGYRTLQRRFKSVQVAYQYENTLKINLVNGCFNSQSLKRKLQGLNQLKEILKSLYYGSNRNAKIIQWIKDEHLFDKVYIFNSHVQLIKKSEAFFRYYINENILQQQDLQKLVKMAQKADYETRISLYSLFNEVSQIFKKPHVDFLIDKILETPINLIMKEDMDLLHELSKFSTYFPINKVVEFFETLILGKQEGTKEINKYAAKKYADIVAKSYQVKSSRKEIVNNLLKKIDSENIIKLCPILKQIFEGIAIGEWGRRELFDLLEDQNVEDVMLAFIRNNKENKNYWALVEEVLAFLLSIFKLSSKFKITITLIKNIFEEIQNIEELKKQYFKWVQELLKCDQSIEISKQNELQKLFTELFVSNFDTSKTSQDEFETFKSFFIEINKYYKNLTVSNIIKEKEIEKQYKRKLPIYELKFYDLLMDMMFDCEDEVVYLKIYELFVGIYCGGENKQPEIEKMNDNYYGKLMQFMDVTEIKPKEVKYLKKVLKILEIIIDDSQKFCEEKIQSLLTKNKNNFIKLSFLNEINYLSESVKKMTITVPLNSTLGELRRHIGKEVSLNWLQIRISDKKQFQDIQNCKTIKELGFNSNDMYNASRRYGIDSIPEAELIIDEEWNPKAARVLQHIFNDFQSEGKMSKDHCMEFTAKCLNSASPRFYADRIDSVYRKYDDDKDGFLTLDNFLDFYKDSAIQKASTVWSNLKSFGIHNDLRLKDEPLIIDNSYLPRYTLSKNQQTYELLFKLLKYPKLATDAFYLLERLPISNKVYKQILSADKQELQVEKFLSLQDKLTLFYKLNVIQYLSNVDQNKSEDEKDWILRFISEKGYQRITEVLFKIIDQFLKGEAKDIDKDVVEIIIDLLQHFLVCCFPSHQAFSCLSLFVDDSDIDDKMQFLVTGKFPKQKTLIVNQKQMIYEFTEITKSEIVNKISQFLFYLWKQSKSSYMRESLITQLLTSLSFLMVNQDPSQLADNLDKFMDFSSEAKQLRKFYCLILCYCFYSKEHQQKFIKQLFKYLTSKKVIEEHFGILAVLADKFGISEVNTQEAKQTLLNNIFESSNQLTIYGCTRLLCNFDLSNFDQKQYDGLCDIIFKQEAYKCNKDQTKQEVYELLFKISSKNMQLSNRLILKLKDMIEGSFEKIRITSCIEANTKSSNEYVGLKNLGSICYINSMMQQMFCNETFRYLIMRIDDKQPQQLVEFKQKMIDDNILHQFQRIFGYLEHSTRMHFIPFEFCFAYKPFGEPVNVIMQQDVQEFISMFFDQIENRIKTSPLKKVINNFYCGQVTNLFKCSQCDGTKKIEEPFYSLSLEIKNSKSLQDSLNRYITGELINDFKCEFCGKKVDVTKKTRISKHPKTLIIHLQRIVFNLQTFINQKITTRHEFPMNFNLFNYTLEEYQHASQYTQQKIDENFSYDLIGIICHIGNAESGHYISYIKIGGDKWLEFNDSIISLFNIKNMQEECFGGNGGNMGVSTVIDDFQWDKMSETTKSAYILLYEKRGENKVELILKSLQEKGALLKELNLEEVKVKLNLTLNKRKASVKEEKEAQVEKQEKKEDEMEEEESEEESEQKEVEIKKEEDFKKEEQLSMMIDPKVTPYISPKLLEQIKQDNKIHFFEKIISSPQFTQFFSKLLKTDHSYQKQIFPLLKKLTFGFWIKSPQFKDLLRTNTHYLQKNPLYIKEIILNNDVMVSLLVENSDSEIRTRCAYFISRSIAEILNYPKYQQEEYSELVKKIYEFLDKLFDMLPTTVSKCWTKFTEYFQFWLQFAKSGKKQFEYTIKKEMIKHFLDYFLDKKSPLKIYANKQHQIGSRYSPPNFNALLRVVTYLIKEISAEDSKFKLSKDENKLLVHYECLEKLMNDNSDNLGVNLVKNVCRNNLHLSEKVAIVLLKGMNRSTFTNVQPYLDILHAYVLIDDQYKLLRIKWVLGRQNLQLTNINKNVTVFASYTYEERLYMFNSTITLEQTASLIDPIFDLHKRAENFCMMSLRELLKLCLEDDFICEYVGNLPSPVIYFSSLVGFFEDFIRKYFEEAKRSHSYHQSSFSKEEMGKENNQLFIQFKQKLEKKKKIQEEKPQKQEETKQEGQLVSSEQEHLKRKQQSDKVAWREVYMPVKFNFIEKSQRQMNGLKIYYHESEVTQLLLRPNGKTNSSMKSSSMMKNIEKIAEECWETKIIKYVKGYFVENQSKHLLRIKTNEGSQAIKSGDSQWIWADTIEDVFVTEKVSDWPKWSLYPIEEQ